LTWDSKLPNLSFFFGTTAVSLDDIVIIEID
jgi:hypothetical protein